MNNQAYSVMVNEYREACRDHYETVYGEKVNTKYRIRNLKTGEIITGSTSGRRDDDEGREIMMTIRRIMVAIFGDDIKEELEKIREEERRKEKEFFKENPQFITYVTDIR